MTAATEVMDSSDLSKALAALRAQLGQEIHCSDWLEVTQARIDAFADATDDHQWIHVDQERAARESPWKSTIVHGYLTLALYPALRGLVDASRPLFAGVQRVINYGLDRLRFRMRSKRAVVCVHDAFCCGSNLSPAVYRRSKSSPLKSTAKRSRHALPKRSCGSISEASRRAGSCLIAARHEAVAKVGYSRD
jgi:hypothetical protein